MATVTISVSDELKEKMVKMPEVNWSAVARKSIIEKIQLLEKLDKITAKSTATEEDSILLGRKVRIAVSKKLRERK